MNEVLDSRGRQKKDDTKINSLRRKTSYINGLPVGTASNQINGAVPLGVKEAVPIKFFAEFDIDVDQQLPCFNPMTDIRDYRAPRKRHLDWLFDRGIDPMALAKPVGIRFATGVRGDDGIFEDTDEGEDWLVFEEQYDVIYWQPGTEAFATRWNRAFALGEEKIDEAATYSFDCNLNIFTDPVAWLRNKRDGIVVLDWRQAFERLRDCPRLAIAEPLLASYHKAMRPTHLPDLYVTATGRAAA